MSDTSDYVLAKVRRHIEERRGVIAARWACHLKRKQYAKLVGQHEELENLAALLQDAIKKANAADTDLESP